MASTSSDSTQDASTSRLTADSTLREPSTSPTSHLTLNKHKQRSRVRSIVPTRRSVSPSIEPG